MRWYDSALVLCHHHVRLSRVCFSVQFIHMCCVIPPCLSDSPNRGDVQGCVQLLELPGNQSLLGLAQ